MQADEASSSTPPRVCWNELCRKHAEYNFECSRAGCAGPRSRPDHAGFSPEIKHVALCGPCATRGICPFCENRIQQWDLRSITAALTSDGDFVPADVLAAPVTSGQIDLETSGQTGPQTLQQFNQNLEKLANDVQKRMNELTKELAIKKGGDHPDIKKLVREAQELFKSLTGQGLQPDGETYRWLLSLFARAKDQDQVELFAGKMEESGKCSTEAYNSIMFSFAVPLGVDRADMWFKRMHRNKCVPDAKSYTILIQACAKSRDSARANLYFERMQLDELKPNAVTFGQLIKACANEDRNPRSLQTAEKIWKQMQQAGVEPNNFMYMSMLQACCCAGNIRRAMYYFEESIKAKFKPDVVTFTAMISVFINKGDVQGAEEWFAKMESFGVAPNVAAFTCVIRVCGAAGDETNAHKWLEKLKAAGYHPNHHTYETLIICALNRKDFAQADVWLLCMLDSGVKRSTTSFHILLEACEPTGNLHQAEKWFNAMVEAGVPPDVDTFNHMLKTSGVYDLSGWLRMSRPSKQQKSWFLKMRDFGVLPNAATYDILTGSAGSICPAVILNGCVRVISIISQLCCSENRQHIDN